MLDNLTRSPTETCANLEPSGQPSKHMEEPLSETPLATSSRLQRQVRALTQHFSVGFLDNARFFQPLSPPRQLFAVLALATSPPLLYAFDRVTLPAQGLSCGASGDRHINPFVEALLDVSLSMGDVLYFHVDHR